MLDGYSQIDMFLEHLQTKYPVSNSCSISFELQDKKVFTTENGSQYYGQTIDAGEVAGIGIAHIVIAKRAPIDLLIIFAHEYCHVLQMYKWKTFPENLKHPPMDHPLEIDAHKFAKLEVETYNNRR